MQSWDRQWFGPVAAIRPYLFQKCFLLLVAFDLLVLMVERGARYGLDAIPFNVPHFVWLDSLHRLYLPEGVPTATYYVCVLVLTSFFAFCAVFAGHRPWLTGIVVVLYTYAWSMSRLDSYLHHYMLTLILSCMVFFPGIDPFTLRNAWATQKSKSKAKNALPTSLATLAIVLVATALGYRFVLSDMVALSIVQRWAAMFVAIGLLAGALWAFRPKTTNAPIPTASSWAYRLLGTTVGVIYIYTSIAKMDTEWCGGHTLREVGTTADVLLPVEKVASSIGLSKETFWASLATFVIPLELTLAVTYLVAVRQDEENRKWLRYWCLFGWLLAIGLHLNNEMMNLIIQWFGYYMLLLATIILLPARILMLLGVAFMWPECWVRERYAREVASLSSAQAALALGATSLLALVSLVAFGYFTWIAGAIVASLILAAGLVLLLVFGMVMGWERNSLKIAACTALASLIMTGAVAQCSMRFDYYYLRGQTLQQLGNDNRAVNEMNLAAILPAPSKKLAAEMHTNRGVSLRRLNEPKAAEQAYRKAIGLDTKQFLAHYGLANLLVQQNRQDEAELHYREAIKNKSDFSDAYVNLGNVLEFKGQLGPAIECYKIAASIEPNAADIKQMLAAAESQLNENKSE